MSDPGAGARPGGFRTVDHAVAAGAVLRAVRTGRPPHALMLVGPPRVGKTTLAFDLAAGLLCLDPDPAARPCGACAGCRKVAHGNHPDVHRLAPEGAGAQVRLAQVQALQSALALLPAEGRHRVAIVERADRLNADAQNALLKTLEEPPAGTCICLVVDDETPILPTVRSRCARLRLSALPAAAIARLLAAHGLADAQRSSRLARLAGGRPGLALALARHPEAEVIEARLMRGSLDLVHADRRARLVSVRSLQEDASALADLLLAADVGAAVATPGEPADEASAGDGGPDGAAEDDGTAASGGTPAPGGPPRGGLAPAARRQGAVTLLAVWRDLCRDLAVAGHGGRAELRRADLLDELEPTARQLEPAALAAFLVRLDGAAAAVEAYANPDLMLDVLALAWPRAVRVA